MIRKKLMAIISILVLIVLCLGSACIKVKAPSTGSQSPKGSQPQTAGNAVAASKYLSIYSNFRYNITASQARDMDQETGFFDVINLPVAWSGTSFSGRANTANGWHGGAGYESAQTGECTISGIMSSDYKTIAGLQCSQSIGWKNGDLQTGSFDMSGIPYQKENDFRNSSSGCKNYHLMYDKRGATTQSGIKTWELRGRSGKTEWQVNKLLWNDNNGLTVTFKYLNCDNN